MTTIKVLSLNCRVWTRDIDKSSPYYWRTRMERIAQMITAQRPDILCLQELTFPAIKYIPKEYRRVTWGFSHSIWMRKSAPAVKLGGGWRIFADYADISMYNYQSVTEKFFTTTFRVINVHGRWNSWARKWMLRTFDKWRHHYPTIAIGDFNNTYEQMKDAGLTYWEYEFDGGKTFENFTNPQSQGFIDLTYHSPAIRHDAMLIIDWGEVRASDHWPIVGEFEV